MQFKLKPATGILAAISVLIFLLSLWPGFAEIISASGGLIPARFYIADNELGAIATIIPVWLTPFTAPFVHAGLFDFILSVLIFILLGSMTEKILGWQGILALFTGGALVGAITVIVLTPESLEALTGSRNVNAAVIAAYFVLHPVANTAPWGNLSAQQTKYLQLLLLWFILSVATAFPSDVTSLVQRVLAPVLSFGTGLLLTMPLLRWKYRNA